MFKGLKKQIFPLAILIGWCVPAFAQPHTQVVKDTFKWFNQISGENKAPFTEKAVAEHFTVDAKMITNNQLVCQGIAEHYQHFLDLNAHYRSLHIALDQIDWRQIDDRIYLHYVIDGQDQQHKALKIHVMGYMVIKNNKINLFNEIICKEMV